MSTTRNPLKGNFTQIPNELVLDKKIPNGAFRVMVYLFSKPSGWVVNNSDIKKQLGIGQNDTIADYWKKLINEGWITRVRNSGGGFDYDLNIEKKLPTELEEGGVFGKTPNRGNPQYGEMPNHSNTDFSSNTEMKQNSPATAEQPPSATQEKEKCTDVPPPPGFDEIWNLYGHKQQKADAIKAYKAMKSQADKNALTEAIPAYLAFLSLPGNSWRQKKLLGAFIRGRMWEDDFAAKKVEHPVNMSDGNGSLYDFVSKEFPNVQKMKWLTNEQFEIFDTRGAEMFGGNYTIYASPIALKKHIRDSFSELNSNSFKRSQYQDVYSYLCEDIKKRIYPK